MEKVLTQNIDKIDNKMTSIRQNSVAYDHDKIKVRGSLPRSQLSASAVATKFVAIGQYDRVEGVKSGHMHMHAYAVQGSTPILV